MKPGRDILPRIYSIGVPAALNIALPSLLIAALNVLLASFSETYILVLGIYYKLQTFLYLPANGIVQGMRPVIGYNYGAGERARVRRIYRVALAMSGVIMAAGTLICLLVPGTLMGLFTSSETTIAGRRDRAPPHQHRLYRVIRVGHFRRGARRSGPRARSRLSFRCAALSLSLFRHRSC